MGSADSIVKFLKTDKGQRLTLVAFAVVATAVLWLFPGSVLAFVLGIPLLIFVPGFAVVRLFFWSGTSPEAKFVLSLGLSILVLIILGLILVLTPTGLSDDTTRASIILFVIGAVAVDILWKRPDKAEARKPAVPELAKTARTIKLDKVVVSMLGTAIAISVISLGLILTANYPSRTYFALTDDAGSVDINTTIEHGSTLNLVIHMKNGESGERTFRMVAHNETILYHYEVNRTLQKGELWEENVSIYSDRWGEFIINFDLYIQKQGSPEYFYGNLHIKIEVV